jgi:2-methylisocitrate lyase-like PEP mutase family enzyme
LDNRLSDEEFERLADTTPLEYEISADAGDCYVDDVEQVKRIVAEARRARESEKWLNLVRDENAALRESERKLREALERIKATAATGDDHVREIAREALKP